MSARVTIVVGARPNFMKAAPVAAALRRLGATVRLVHTGQHYDEEMSAVFVRQLGMPMPDVFLSVGSGSHGVQTARALERVEADLLAWRPDCVIVPGDVNSTLAAALAGSKLGIPVCHLEAGLRSYDRSMPEESNRVVADHLASLLLVHSDDAAANLAREGITAGVHNVGNTMIDSLVSHLDAARAGRPWEELDVVPGTYLLVTLHRPSLVDDPDRLSLAAEALARIAADVPVVFPAHPRTRQRLSALGLDTLPGVRLTPPLPYLAFLGLEAEARAVLTDSGGVQEETSALGVPCFTLRSTTERPITVELGTNRVIGADPRVLDELPTLLGERRPTAGIPLWDGKAGPRAAAAVLTSIG